MHVPVPFEPTTELVAAATACGLGVAGGRVLRTTREQLARAVAAMPSEGLPSVWWQLADIAARYCRDWDGKAFAPPMNFAPLIKAAVDAGTGPRPGQRLWQERMQ